MAVNRTYHIGRLTDEPELRYTPDNTAVADFTLAVDDSYVDNAETNFFDVTVWRSQAENCSEYLDKGSQVHVEGRLTQDTWQTEDGDKRSKVKIVANSVQFLDNKSDSGGDSEQSGATDDDVPF